MGGELSLSGSNEVKFNTLLLNYIAKWVLEHFIKNFILNTVLLNYLYVKHSVPAFLELSCRCNYGDQCKRYARFHDNALTMPLSNCYNNNKTWLICKECPLSSAYLPQVL